MTSQPAIPSLLLIPDESQIDHEVLYSTAIAYADSGLHISAHCKDTGRMELFFPAVVCSSFAIELFLKYFLMLDKAERGGLFPDHVYGHLLKPLWQNITPKHQALIAGMFLNDSGEPFLDSADRRIELFEEALANVGEKPFIDLLYPQELIETTLISHTAIKEVLNALGYAANFARKERAEVSQSESLKPSNVINRLENVDETNQPDSNKLLQHRVSERPLIGHDSVLRQIPVNINPKQALFLDGIRHSVEIMDIAYDRLRDALTHLALHPPAANELPALSAHAFLDAWSFVDAVDRFRMMYLKMPGINFGTAQSGVPTLHEITQEFRNLRNVADHLAQRADFVISRNGAALGELTWITGAELQPKVIAWHCTLRPGTLRSIPPTQTNQIVANLNWPTGSIRLSAGGYEGNLSEVRQHIAVRIKHLEAQLQQVFQQPGQANMQVISDMFSRRPITTAATGEARQDCNAHPPRV